MAAGRSYSRLIHILALSGVLPSVGALGACGSDEETTTCDPDAANACNDGLVCAKQQDGGGKCQLPPGAACDPEASDPNCQVGSSCQSRPEDAQSLPEHLCLIAKAGDCEPVEPYCEDGLTCAALEDGAHQCHLPLLVHGTVHDGATQAAIEGAHVIALDAESVAVTDVAKTQADGSYALELPALRDAEGKPVATSYTLRGAAQLYQTFPSGLRTAIPFNSSDAEARGEGFVIESSVTDISLIELPDDGTERHIVSGHLRDADGSTNAETLAQLSGVLMVAEGKETWTSITDKQGAFTVFNVPDGEFELGGYAAGVAVKAQPVSIAGADKADLQLMAKLGELSTVSGSVQLVNPGDGDATSVILVVESTFQAAFARGDSPRGLRAPQKGAPSVTGSFSIAHVPDGDYVVLAGFENDALVRDPDTNIAGTDVLHITVNGGNVEMPDSFKVTGALAVLAPGAGKPEAVSSPPMLEWADDSSEDWYDVHVYDAFGEEVWNALKVPGQSGGDSVSLRYEGPMDVGMYYQFRVTSWRSPGGKMPAPISATEDLRGVFYITP